MKCISSIHIILYSFRSGTPGSEIYSYSRIDVVNTRHVNES